MSQQQALHAPTWYGRHGWQNKAMAIHYAGSGSMRRQSNAVFCVYWTFSNDWCPEKYHTSRRRTPVAYSRSPHYIHIETPRA